MIEAEWTNADALNLQPTCNQLATDCRGYPIDADFLMAKVAEEYGERARDALYRIIRYMPPAQPVLTCDGCRHVGTYDTDFPCNGCVRREKDYYDPER